MYNSIGGYGSQFGGQMNNMGQQPVRNDRMGYAPGGMPQQNPNYAQLGQGVSNQFNQYGQMGQQIAGHMGGYGGGYGNMGQQISGHLPGYGSMGQQIGANMGGYGGGGQMNNMAKQFNGGGWNVAPDNDAAYGRPYFGGGFNPSPDTGALDNPEMQNPFRSFNNGNPFYNAKGNLRMRYRPGGQMGGAFAQGMQPGTYY